MNKKLAIITFLIMNLFIATGLIVAQTAPIKWVVPESFDAKTPELGLIQLPGVSNTIIYDPLPSFGAIECGGPGQYESVLHGTYNHHTQALLFKDKVLVYWTNQSNDENGPAERIHLNFKSISLEKINSINHPLVC